ncbi:hypothetical protein [Streptomyces sp. NBC_00649]|uniref:hypothetical protein n=1 Tax=Streptomyces sp. NBC_00649 TaxID=2975798 RepID=UPI0032454A96
MTRHLRLRVDPDGGARSDHHFGAHTNADPQEGVAVVVAICCGSRRDGVRVVRLMRHMPSAFMAVRNHCSSRLDSAAANLAAMPVSSRH